MRKRVSILMVVVYTFASIFTCQTALAEDIKTESIWLKDTSPITTTSSQIEVDPGFSQTTSAMLTVLVSLIEQSEYLINEAPISTTPGSYTIENRMALQYASQKAIEARETATTEEELLQAVNQLHQAIIDFKASRRVDVGQLGLAAYYLGKQIGEEKWQYAQWFDIDHNGVVNRVDLMCLNLKNNP